MLSLLREPLSLVSIAAGIAGLLLLAHARVQTRLLRRRVSVGEGTEIIDPITGLFAPATTRQCVRAEANRAARLGTTLDVWVAAITGDERALAFDLPVGATGIRLSQEHVCVVSCVGSAADPAAARPDLTWQHASFEPTADLSDDALAYLEDAAGA